MSITAIKRTPKTPAVTIADPENSGTEVEPTCSQSLLLATKLYPAGHVGEASHELPTKVVPAGQASGPRHRPVGTVRVVPEGQAAGPRHRPVGTVRVVPEGQAAGPRHRSPDRVVPAGQTPLTGVAKQSGPPKVVPGGHVGVAKQSGPPKVVPGGHVGVAKQSGPPKVVPGGQGEATHCFEAESYDVPAGHIGDTEAFA
jgi:hypothetical protein